MKKIIILICLSLFSCDENKQIDESEYWINRPITINHDMQYTVYGLDTVDYNHYDNAKYKMFVYVDSLGCTSCNLELHKLKKFLNLLDERMDIKLPVLLYFNNMNVNKITTLLRSYRYNDPVYIDLNGYMANKYEFTEDLSAFLLDSLGNVKLIGYPPHDIRLEQQYLNELVKTKYK